MNATIRDNSEQELRGSVKELLRKRETADLIAVSPRMIDSLRKQGLPHVKLGPRCVRYPRRAVLDWIAGRTVGTGR